MFSPISATSRRLFQQDVTVTLAMFDSAVGLLYLLCFYNSRELLGGSFKSFTKSVKTVQITVTLWFHNWCCLILEFTWWWNQQKVEVPWNKWGSGQIEFKEWVRFCCCCLHVLFFCLVFICINAWTSQKLREIEDVYSALLKALDGTVSQESFNSGSFFSK